MPKLNTPAFLTKLPKRTLWVVLMIVILAGAGGYTYYRMFYKPRA